MIMNKISYILTGCFTLILTSCHDRSNSEATLSETDNQALTVLNSPQIEVSANEVDSNGYIVLFDGKSLKGWRGYNDCKIPDNWTIKDGYLKNSSCNIKDKTNSSRGDLIFARKFKNFELSLEWKASKGAQSGIMYMVREIKDQPISSTSLKYQIADHGEEQFSTLPECRKVSSLYDLIPAKAHNVHRGDWNHSIIRIVDGVVEHFLNGEKVLQYTLWNSQWENMLASSAFSAEAAPEVFGFLKNCGGENREGYIGLQDMGSEVNFRNIKVKVLA